MTRAAVLGSPIAHSRSPVLHRAAYEALGLDWTYEAIDVPSGELANLKTHLDDSWRGLSLTMPLKEEVLELLDDCDPVATLTRSANTVVIEQGRWLGSNTDVSGMVAALRGIGAAGSTATILGAGATARSAVAACRDLGISQLRIWARRPNAAQALAEVAERCGLHAQCTDTPQMASDIVISTLPASAAPDQVGPGFLLDCIYHPWPPPLTDTWAPERRATGLDLLLWQAVGQVAAMTGMTPPVAAMAAALWSSMGIPQPREAD